MEKLYATAYVDLLKVRSTAIGDLIRVALLLLP